MEKHKGTTRTVFVFKNIVIKIARIYWSSLVKIMFHLLLDKIKYLTNKEYRMRCKFVEIQDIEEQQINNLALIEKEKRLEIKEPPIRFYEYVASFGINLLGGIMANYQEYKFYIKTKNIFVMPTYFSFLGIFNIQKRGEKIDFWKDRDIWLYLCSNSKKREQPMCDSHTFLCIDNFVLDNGHLKMVDYGSRRIELFLKINGEKLYNNFKHP